MSSATLCLLKKSNTLSELLDGMTAAWGTSVAFHEKKQGIYQHISFGRFGEEVQALAAALLRRIPAGSRVLILGKSSYASVLAITAVASGIGAALPLAPTVKEDTLLRLVRDSGIAAVLYEDGARATVEALALPCKLSLQELPCLINEGREYVRAADAADAACVAPLPTRTDAALLLYTVGARCTALSHEAVLRLLIGFGDAVPLQPRDILLSHLPLSFAAELLCGIFYPLCCGASVAFAEGTGRLMRNMREIHPTAMVTLPFIGAQIADKFARLIKENGREAAVRRAVKLTATVTPFAARLAARRRLLAAARSPFGGALRTLIVVGGRLETGADAALARMGVLPVSCYAPRAVGIPVALCRQNGTLGRLLPGVALRLDENGELLVDLKGLGADAEISADGALVFPTGDMGALAENGTYRLRGRVENRILCTDGTYICAEELEAMMLRGALIKEAVAVSLSHSDGTAELAAMILPDPLAVGQADDAANMGAAMERAVGAYLSEINAKLPTSAQITAFALATAPLPRDAVGRVQRHAVTAQLLAAMEQEHQNEEKEYMRK